MNLSNSYQIGFQRGIENCEFLQPLEIAARLSVSSGEFCKLWELYELGYARGVRVMGWIKRVPEEE